MRAAALVFILLVAAEPAASQELYLFGGSMQDAETREDSHAWQIEYLQGLGTHLAFSISYLNEGHLTNHHRDGHLMQGWVRSDVLHQRISLGVGLGPFYYFDTNAAAAGASYSNDHGWGGVLSFAGIWNASDRWRIQLLTNWVETDRTFDTLSVLIGAGYRLETFSPGEKARLKPAPIIRNEITIFVGRTIVNSFGSEPSLAAALEYRRSLLRYLDWTISWLHEGENSMIRRNGIISQIWGIQRFFEDKLSLGIGGGGYYAVDRYRDEQYQDSLGRTLSGIVTISAGYRLNPEWGIRLSWNRIVTNYSRDTDVILGGIAYLF